MTQYPKLSKMVTKRTKILMVLFLVLAFNLITGGIELLIEMNRPLESTYLSKIEQTAIEQGKPLSGEDRAAAIQQDEIRAQSNRSIRQVMGVATSSMGLLMLGCSIYCFMHRKVEQSRLAKFAAKLAAWNGEENIKQTLSKMESELDSPVYESRQVILTNNWLIGYTGLTRKAVAFPLETIVGIFYYDHILESGKGNNCNQIVIADRLEKDLSIQFRNINQRDEFYNILLKRCPNAETGTHQKDFLDHYCLMPKQERKALIDQILRKNGVFIP